jgi:hypothetical protein
MSNRVPAVQVYLSPIRPQRFWRFAVIAIGLVGLILGTCLAAPADATPDPYRVCGAAKAEELSTAKTSSPELGAVPVDHRVLSPGVLQSGRLPLDLTSSLVPVILWGDSSPRAPPTLL